jgi:protocatechuate 3,4-dioxygenase beta subunit
MVTSRKVDVAAGKTVSDVVLELDPAVRLTGKVTDANGTPLSGVTITISPAMGG